MKYRDRVKRDTGHYPIPLFFAKLKHLASGSIGAKIMVGLFGFTWIMSAVSFIKALIIFIVNGPTWPLFFMILVFLFTCLYLIVVTSRSVEIKRIN